MSTAPGAAGPPLRIVSLLPGATELVCALGLEARLVGVSHECDFPESVRQLPRLTGTDIDSHRTSAEIHAQVGATLEQGAALYRLDEPRLAELQPDLVLTQSTCEVCAVPFAVVGEATRRLLGPGCQLLSLSPASPAEVLQDIARVAAAAGVPDAGVALVARLEARARRLCGLTGSLERPRTLVLEWLDPPMVAGHWTPELIGWAGGDPVLGHPGAPTKATTWEELSAARPEVVLVLPCGYKIEQTRGEMPALLGQPGVREWPAVQAGRVVLLDGNGHFNRPGPRLWDSAELAARALWPELELALGPAAPELLLRWR